MNTVQSCTDFTEKLTSYQKLIFSRFDSLTRKKCQTLVGSSVVFSNVMILFYNFFAFLCSASCVSISEFWTTDSTKQGIWNVHFIASVVTNNWEISMICTVFYTSNQC